MDLIYLDNNATTKVDEAVFEEMMPYFCAIYGNPSSLHPIGQRAKTGVDAARKKVADFIGASPSEIVFTSCGSESDSTAIVSALMSLPERHHVITTSVEHLAVLDCCRDFAHKGYRVTEIGVDGDGNFDEDAYAAALDDDTALVSVMWANNETGVVFPVEEIARAAKRHGALVHVDAVQVAGKIPIDMRGSSIDTLALSGHKFHAPKGIGALYIREGTPFHKLFLGGHQERNRRAGTENTASIIGFGKACELAAAFLEHEATYVKDLRDRLQEGLCRAVPGAAVLGCNAERTPNTLCIAFPYAQEDGILQELSEMGICASSGSACNSRTLDASHVLTAMGVPSSLLNGAIRFSLSRYSTRQEIDRLIEVMPRIINDLESMSIWDKEQ